MNEPVGGQLCRALQDSGIAEAGPFRTVFPRVAPAMPLATLDQTIVAAALPVIGSSLGSLAQVAWVVTAYLLAATVAAPVYGRMGDAFGCFCTPSAPPDLYIQTIDRLTPDRDSP